MEDPSCVGFLGIRQGMYTISLTSCGAVLLLCSLPIQYSLYLALYYQQTYLTVAAIQASTIFIPTDQGGSLGYVTCCLSYY